MRSAVAKTPWSAHSGRGAVPTPTRRRDGRTSGMSTGRPRVPLYRRVAAALTWQAWPGLRPGACKHEENWGGYSAARAPITHQGSGCLGVATANDDLTDCLRCGAMVERTGKHKRWHVQLGGTSDPLPPHPQSAAGSPGWPAVSLAVSSPHTSDPRRRRTVAPRACPADHLSDPRTGWLDGGSR